MDINDEYHNLNCVQAPKMEGQGGNLWPPILELA